MATNDAFKTCAYLLVLFANKVEPYPSKVIRAELACDKPKSKDNPNKMPSSTKKSVPAIEEVDTSYLETLIGYNARRAALTVISQFVEHMAVYGLNPVEFSVMSVVVHNPGVTSRQLCSALNILPPNLVGLVQLLENRRLIERKPHPHDGRAFGLHPTQEGEALMAKAEVTAVELEMNSCAKLTSNQVQTLITLLQKIYL